MREEEEKERKRDLCWPTCKTVPPSFLTTKDTPTPRTPNKMTGREGDMELKIRNLTKAGNLLLDLNNQV